MFRLRYYSNASDRAVIPRQCNAAVDCVCRRVNKRHSGWGMNRDLLRAGKRGDLVHAEVAGHNPNRYAHSGIGNVAKTVNVGPGYLAIARESVSRRAIRQEADRLREAES